MGVVLSGGRVDYLLGSAVDDGLGLLLGEEDSGGLADVVGTELTVGEEQVEGGRSLVM